MLYIMNGLSVMSGYFAVNNFHQYGIENGLTNEKYLAWVGSAAAICNSIRFVWSTMTDYLSYKLVYSILLIMQIILNGTIHWVSHNEALFGIWISLMLLGEGGHFVLVPNVLKKIYGAESGTVLYGILFSYTGITSTIQIFLQKAILTEDASGYNILFYVNGLASCIALALLLLFFNERQFVP